MSHELLNSVVICAVQVSVIAVTAYGITLAILRHRPKLSKTVAYPASIIILVLTALIVVPIPPLSDALSRIGLRQPAPAEVIRGKTVSPSRQSGADTYPTSTPPLLSADAQWLRNALGRLAVSGQQQSRFAKPLAVIAGLIVTVFFGRLILGIWAAIRLSRTASLVRDRAALLRIQMLATALKINRRVVLKHTPRLTGAAVTGWRNPIILLPDNWTDWTDDELTAVLAHELAHIANNDYFWRIIYSITGALHAWNPLVHIMNRRIIFAQELNADLAAAQCVGSHNYIRALSSLALARDKHEESYFTTGPAPVFSGYLIRRIKMLDQRNEFSQQPASVVAGRLLTTALILLGATLFATGSVARPVAQAEELTTSNVRADEQPSPTNKTEPADPTRGMFRRSKLDLSTVPEKDTGYARIRFADIRRELIATPLIEGFNAAAAVELMNAFSMPQMPRVDLKVIDQIHGSAQMTLRHDSTRQKDKNTLMLGMGNFNVSLTQPVDLKTWINDFVPDTVHSEHEGRDFYTLPAIPSLGPVPFSVTARAPKVLCFGSEWQPDKSEPKITGLIRAVSHSTQSNGSAWVEAFQRVDGGLVTFAATDKEFDFPDKIEPDAEWSETERREHELAFQIAQSLKTCSLGIDYSVEKKEIGIRSTLNFETRNQADNAKKCLLELISLSRTELASKPSENTTNDPVFQWITALRDNMWMTVHNNDDGTAHVFIAATATAPQISDLMGTIMEATSE